MSILHTICGQVYNQMISLYHNITDIYIVKQEWQEILAFHMTILLFLLFFINWEDILLKTVSYQIYMEFKSWKIMPKNSEITFKGINK